jgi:type IV pilus assembly protein PilV
MRTAGINGSSGFHRQHGFSLIEVLIAAIILAVSLLGLISLQTQSYFTTFESRQNVQAIYAAQDIIERLRMNRIAWIDTNLASASTTYSVNVGTNQTSIAQPGCTDDSGLMNCATNALQVQHDLFSWQSLVTQAHVSGATSLLNPVGCLSLTRDNNTDKKKSLVTAQVIVSWQDKEDMADASAANGNTCGASGTKNRQLVVSATI